jgi:NAD-dependent dihydropyrimidine dehydrogenase PreA subunit
MDRYLANVSTLHLDAARCSGCKTCVAVCPHQVWAAEDRTAAIIDLDGCMECGAFAMNCERGAITVRKGTGCANALIAAALRPAAKQECC